MVLGSIVAGCTQNFEDYNRNPKQPTSIPTSYLLESTLRSIAFQDQNQAQRMYTFWGVYSGQLGAVRADNWGVGPEQVWAYYNPAAIHRNTPMSIIFGLIYPNHYYIEDATGKSGVIYAVSLLMRVYGMHIVASAQGPIPYSQMAAGKTETVYDDEETAWKAMFDDLDTVIGILSGSGESNADLAAVDYIYGGNVRNWLKFANTLKLRMALRVSNVATYAQQKAEEAVASGVMTDVAESAWVHLDKASLTNPWFIGWLGHNDDCQARPNACLVSWMNGYNDPRREKYFTPASDGTYVGMISGPQNSSRAPGDYISFSKIRVNGNFDAQPVMYAAEAAFLRAEGALKGWNMNGTAESLYHEGIRLSLNEFGVGSAYADYIQTTSQPANHNAADGQMRATSTISVKWSNDPSQHLEQIITQKWIALWLDPMNGWADNRRTGYPKLWLATKSANVDVDASRGARRTPFPQAEYNTNNANVQAAAAMIGGDSMGNDLWWALKN